MTKYLATFSFNQDGGVDQQAFKEVLDRLDSVTRSELAYVHQDGASVTPNADNVSFDISAEDRPLFGFLSDVYAALRPQEWGMSFAHEDGNGLPAVTLYGGLSIEGEGILAGQTKYVAAEEILISADVFVVTWPGLFLEPEDDAVGPDGEVTYDTVAIGATAPLLFTLPGLAIEGDQELEELILILPDSNLRPEAVMGGIVGTDQSELIDEGHLMLVDAEGDTVAEALEFTSDRGGVIELRVHVQNASDTGLRRVFAQRAASLTRAAPLLIIEEDFETFTFDVRPIQNDGTLGPAERIVYSTD